MYILLCLYISLIHGFRTAIYNTDIKQEAVDIYPSEHLPPPIVTVRLCEGAPVTTISESTESPMLYIGLEDMTMSVDDKSK